MSNNKNIPTLIGVGASFASIIALIYGNLEIKAIGSFLLGSLFTYFIQRRLQEDARMSAIRRANIEETFIPLQLKFEQIHEELVDAMREPTSTAWDSPDILENMFSSKQRFILTQNFRIRLYDFKESYEKYKDDLREARKDVSDVINTKFNSNILTSGKYTDGNTFRIKESKDWRYPDFQLKNNYRGYYRNVLLDKPIALGINPVEATLDRYPESTKYDLEVVFEAYNEDREKAYQRIPYFDIAKDFENYLIDVFGIVNGIESVIALRLQNKELIMESQKILVKLERYNKKYYPVENSL